MRALESKTTSRVPTSKPVKGQNSVSQSGKTSLIQKHEKQIVSQAEQKHHKHGKTKDPEQIYREKRPLLSLSEGETQSL